MNNLFKALILLTCLLQVSRILSPAEWFYWPPALRALADSYSDSIRVYCPSV